MLAKRCFSLITHLTAGNDYILYYSFFYHFENVRFFKHGTRGTRGKTSHQSAKIRDHL